jgi:hypothetical protein
MKEVVGNCPICSREMIKGSSINDHHFIPKSKGGKAEDKITLHKVCHDFLHRQFREVELMREFNTPEKCLEQESVLKFVKWLKKKDPEFVGTVKVSKRKGKR